MTSFEIPKTVAHHSDSKSSSSKLKSLKKIANTSSLEDSLQKTLNSYESTKPQLQNLQKYQKIFTDASIIQDLNSHVPNSFLNKSLASAFKSVKRGHLDSILSFSKKLPSEKNELTDLEVQKKSQMTQNLLGEELSKKREKIKSINDISFLQNSKDMNRTINKESSLIRDGPETMEPSQRKSQNFYEKMYTYDHGNKYEVSLGTLKEKFNPDVFSQKLPSRVFNLSNLGYDEIPSSSLNSLNKTLKSSSQTQLHFHTSQNKLLKNPNSRKDVEELDAWLKYMIAQQEATMSSEDNVKKILENTQIIYNACLKEIIRQISINCSERGQFIQKIWDAYLGLLERALIENKKENALKDQENVEEAARIHKMYQREIESLGELIKTLQFDKERLETSNHSSRDRIKELKRRLKELKEITNSLEKENEGINKENEILLKANLDMSVTIDDLMHGGNQPSEKSKTFSPQQFTRSSYNKRNMNYGASPKGNKEKLGLFTDKGASVVAHLMYFKTGEIVQPVIKLADLQKVKEKFPEDEQIESLPQSPFSPKRLAKLQTLELKPEIEKTIEDAPKENLEDNPSSDNSIDNKEDKNEGTDEILFEDKAVNTDEMDDTIQNNIHTGTFTTKYDENKDFEEFINDLLEEGKNLSEDEKQRLRLRILQEVKEKLGSSMNLIRRMTLVEQEADEIKRKYRNLVIQISEMEIEKGLLNDQLKTAHDKAKTFEIWNEELEDNSKNTEEDDKKDGHVPFESKERKNILQTFFDKFLEIEEPHQNNEKKLEKLPSEDKIIEGKKDGSDNSRSDDESEESEISIMKNKVFRTNSETNLKKKEEIVDKKRRNSEVAKTNNKMKKNSWNRGPKGKKVIPKKKTEKMNKHSLKEDKEKMEVKITEKKAVDRKERVFEKKERPEKNTKARERTLEKPEKEKKTGMDEGLMNERSMRKSQDKNQDKMLEKVVQIQEKNVREKFRERTIEKLKDQNERSVYEAAQNKQINMRSANESLVTRFQKKAATLSKMLKPMFRNNYKGFFSVNTEDANAILFTVNSLQAPQIRPLSIQMVLKFICTVYQERSKAGSNSQTPLHIYCYDFFISQYGLKKIADDKLKKILSSCLYYQEKNNRINIFCRLVGIKCNADPYDMTYYLSCIKFFEENPRESVNITSNYSLTVNVSFSEVNTFIEENYKSKLHKDTYQKLDAVISEKKILDTISQRISLSL